MLVRRVAWARRDDYAVRGHVAHLAHRDLVVAEDLRVTSHLAHVLGEVVDERVVVVDDEDLHLLPSPISRLPVAFSTALISPAALDSVSCHSASGSESATMPAPDWMLHFVPLATRVRMVIAKSALPLKEK